MVTRTPSTLQASTPTGPGLVRRLIPLAVIAAGLATVVALDLGAWLSFDTLAANRGALAAAVADNLGMAAAAFVAIYGITVALSIPGAVILTLAGGFLFGTILGSVLVVLGATLGAVAIFLAARTALGDLLRARAAPWMARLEEGFRRDAFHYLLALRLVPVFPFWLVNLMPAFLGVRLSTYTLATVIGIVPGSVVYTSVGSGLGTVIDAGGRPDLNVLFAPEILLPVLGLAILSLVPILNRRWKRGRTGS